MKKGKIIILVVLILSVVALSIIPSLASNEMVLDNTFEDSSSSAWVDKTGRGVKTIETEASGNKYLAMTSNATKYYDYRALNTNMSGLLCFDYDIQFPKDNMEIQIRNVVNNSATGFTMAARIRKVAYYLEYYSDGKYEKMLDTNRNWLNLNNTNIWYHIKMILDTVSGTQSIYLTERDTGRLVSSVENVPFMAQCSSVNYFGVSSENKVCMDNVKFIKMDVKALKVTGETYPVKSDTQTKTYQYSCNNITSSNSIGDIADDVVWSIEKPVTGVSINAQTGILTIEPTAKLVPVMIKVAKKNAPSVKGSYLVDIER